MTMKIILVLSAFFCLASLPSPESQSALASPIFDLSRAKRQATIPKCLLDLQSCNEKFEGKDRLQNSFMDAVVFKDNCKNIKPYMSCCDKAISQCSSSDANTKILIQLMQGAKTACRDPKVAEIVTKPENQKCFNQSVSFDIKEELEPCLLLYFRELMDEHDTDICGKHDRFASCVKTAISDICSPESSADYVYILDVTLSGYTNGLRGDKSCLGGVSGGSPVKESTSLLWILFVAVMFSIRVQL